MKINDAKSCLFEFNNINALIDLLDRNIFYYEDYTIFKFKICDIKLCKIDSEIMIILCCTPCEYKFYNLYPDDIELRLDEVNKNWFYDETSARNYKIQQAKNRQVSLW